MCARCVCDIVSLLVQRNDITITTHTNTHTLSSSASLVWKMQRDEINITLVLESSQRVVLEQILRFS